MIQAISSRRVSSIAVTVLLSTLSLACSGNKPAETPEAAPAEEPSADALPGKDPSKSEVKIGPRIAEACGIDESETFFSYNSAKLSKSADGLLVKLTECFTTGPLAGQNMNIVGHTDPRGEDEYNMTLGGRRADAVSAALTEKGLPAGQLSTTSRGEAEARGTDEAGWASDRKVELLLAE